MGNITHITSGKSNLTKNVASLLHMHGSVVLCLPGCTSVHPKMDTSFGPSESTTQTAYRSLQPFLGRIARTMYVDAVYCYRPSSLVCHTSEPCKNGWTDRDAVWVMDLGGTNKPCIRWGFTSRDVEGKFWGWKWASLCKV